MQIPYANEVPRRVDHQNKKTYMQMQLHNITFVYDSNCTLVYLFKEKSMR